MKRAQKYRRYFTGIVLGFALGGFSCNPTILGGVALGMLATIAVLDLIDMMSEDP